MIVFRFSNEYALIIVWRLGSDYAIVNQQTGDRQQLQIPRCDLDLALMSLG